MLNGWPNPVENKQTKFQILSFQSEIEWVSENLVFQFEKRLTLVMTDSFRADTNTEVHSRPFAEHALAGNVDDVAVAAAPSEVYDQSNAVSVPMVLALADSDQLVEILYGE